MKTPAATEVTTSAPNSAKHTRAGRRTTKPNFTPRQLRLANALAAGRWISREDVDRIVGASNGPDVVLQLRRRVTGDDGIEMRMVDGSDRDGQAIKFGQYRMTHEGMRRAVLAGLLPDAALCEAGRDKRRKVSGALRCDQGELFALGVMHGERS